MDAYHRDIILSNIDTLTEWTNYEKLKDGCTSRNILSGDTILEIEKTSDNTKLRHDKLLRKITEVKPNAFKVLVEICQSNFWDAADFLASFEEPQCTQIISTFGSGCSLTERVVVETDGNVLGNVCRQSDIEDIPLQLFTGTVTATLNVIPAVEFGCGRILAYPMRSVHRGVLFLVNIIHIKDQPNLHRNGAILDKERLITLFQQFGFKIFYYENLTLKEFRHLVGELIKSKYLRATDCLVFCVLSHGCFKDGHQMIQFSDGENGSIEDVIVKFSNRSCPYLRRKPKLFIFPMCRGISSKIKVTTFDTPNANLQCDNVPAFSDIKICYGSVKGLETFRDRNDGSWYILAFCEILATFAHREHFYDLHKMIGQRLESHCQRRSNGNESFVQTISSEDLGFTQHLFFNPGYYG